MKAFLLVALTVLSVAMPTMADVLTDTSAGIFESEQQRRPQPRPRQPPRRPDDRRDDRRNDRRDDICRLSYAGRSETSREGSLSRCQGRVNDAVVRYCNQNPNGNLSVTYRWNGQGDTAFFPCRGWGRPAGGPACTISYAGRTETTHEVAMGACQQRVNEAVIRYCPSHKGQRLSVQYRWNGQGATANFNCN